MVTQDHKATRRTAAEQEAAERRGSNPSRRKPAKSSHNSKEHGMSSAKVKRGGY